MTSYRYFSSATIESEIYFRVRFWWWYSFRKMEVYWRTKFRWDVSIRDWDETTSGSENGRPPFWNSITGFYFCLIFIIGASFCIGLPNFVKIELPLAALRHIDFFKLAVGSHIGFDLDNIKLIDNPRSAIVGERLVLQFGLDRIYSLGDIAIFIFSRFGLKMSIHAHFWGL